MIYSCFDDKSGRYRYFEDGSQRAVNSDLPIPSLNGKATKLGVPSTEAGRDLPLEAKPCGSGYRARGILVQCGPSSSGRAMGSLFGDGSGNATLVAVAIGCAVTGFVLGKMSSGNTNQRQRQETKTS